MKYSHYAERTLDGQTEESARVTREDVTDLQPVDRVQQTAVGGVVKALLHVQQRPHQHLQL